MAGKGPAPIPTPIKLAQGRRGAKAKLKTEPVPDAELPKPPTTFTAREKAKFYEMRDKIEALRLASATDREMLTVLTQRLVEIEELTEVIRKEGRVYQTLSKLGERMVRPRPETRMLNEAMRHAQALLHEFGLSPAARSKVRVDGKKNGDDWDGF